MLTTGTEFTYAKDYVSGCILFLKEGQKYNLEMCGGSSFHYIILDVRNPLTEETKFFKIDSKEPQPQITEKIDKTVEEICGNDWIDIVKNIK